MQAQTLTALGISGVEGEVVFGQYGSGSSPKRGASRLYVGEGCKLLPRS